MEAIIITEDFIDESLCEIEAGVENRDNTDAIIDEYEDVSAELVVFHWKYNPGDGNVSEGVIVDTLPLQKSS